MSVQPAELHSWGLLTRDADGHREYKVIHQVQCDETDGPANALQASALPQAGDTWLFRDDIDVWAYCRENATVTAEAKKNNTVFYIEQLFSTKGDEKRCKDQQIDDPLLEPQKVSGGGIKYVEEAIEDRFGDAILTSSHEPIRGPQVEFDANRSTVRIEQNVADLELDVCEGMRNTLNDTPLWGLPARCIKLSDFNWVKKFYGACNAYYTRIFDFDTYAKLDNDPASATYGQLISGFDRDLLDEGSKALYGHWDPTTGDYVLDPIDDLDTQPDANDPSHFAQFLDRAGNPCRVILNGAGLPANANIEAGTSSVTTSGDPGKIHVEKYSEGDFTLLGIPLIL